MSIDATDPYQDAKAEYDPRDLRAEDGAPQPMYNWLVFEQDTPPEYDPRYAAQIDAPTLLNYQVKGAVRATDATAAATAVVKATRRVGKYAVIQATLIDFTANFGEAEPNRPQLNP